MASAHRAGGRRIQGLRRRLSQGFDAAIAQRADALDERLRALLRGDFESLDQVYRGDAVAMARLRGLRTTLDGYRALLLEQAFGRIHNREQALEQARVWLTSTQGSSEKAPRRD